MKLKHIVLALVLVCQTTLFADVKAESNSAEIKPVTEVKNTFRDQAQIKKLLLQKELIESELLDNNILSKTYSNYHTYNELKKQNSLLDIQIKHLKERNKRSSTEEKQLDEHLETRATLVGKLQLLKEYEQDPFKKFLTPPVIADIPKIGNPFALIGALSYREKLKSDEEEYEKRYFSLTNSMEKFLEKRNILLKLMVLDTNNPDYQDELTEIDDEIKTFTPIIEIFKTTKNVYIKKVEEIDYSLKGEIERELEHAISIGALIIFFLLLLLLIKYFVRKYMSDNDRFYTINKALNTGFILITIMTILFAYIQNVSYLVTILGFASAGIAIAMKDWFMSLMGWATIMVGGSISVGDRVRFIRDGVEYVGDIVDISMLRMTMHEDITLTTYAVNRRAGRMVFIPNNYIFTEMISNYSHAGLKTVWDGIDFIITFDSDANKAALIAKEITRKYSKGYTEITRKQLNKLRSRYGMRNTNVEPRIFTHIEPYGLKISAWYLTNSFATMTLRSTISVEIITRIQAEEGIHLAYPSQSIFVDQNMQSTKTMPNSEEF